MGSPMLPIPTKPTLGRTREPLLSSPHLRRTPSWRPLPAANQRHGSDGRARRSDELQGCADEVEAMATGGGELLQRQVLDNVDAAAGEEDQVPRHETPELGIAHPGHVPRHVVGPDREDMPLREPVGGARRHPRPGEVAVGGVPVPGVARPHERHGSGLDAHALALAALLEVFVGDGVAGLEGFDALAGRHVEEDSRGEDRGYLFDAVPFEASGGLHTTVHLHAAVEHEAIGLVAEGVYVGAGVLGADYDPGGAGARPFLLRPVLVLVVAVQEVGVAGLHVRGMDGHPGRTRLLEVERARPWVGPGRLHADRLPCVAPLSARTSSSPLTLTQIAARSVAGPAASVNGGPSYAR